MAEKELRKMKRIELIEIIYALQESEKKLQEERDMLKAELDKRTIQIAEAGSIAEAAVGLSNIFKTAQETADQYLSSVYAANADADALAKRTVDEAQIRAGQLLAQGEEEKRKAQLEAEIILRQAREKSDVMIHEAEKETEVRWSEFDAKVKAALKLHDELNTLLSH